MNTLKLATLVAAVAGLTACGAKATAQPTPQPTVTVTATPTATPTVTPSRIVTLEDIIQGCTDAMVKAMDIPLYEDRPKACVQLGQPEFTRASDAAIPLISERFATESP
jgi:hypothetical protein